MSDGRRERAPSRRRLAALVASILALVALVACGTVATRAQSPPRQPPADQPPERADRRLVVAVAGESLGNLEPCNCVQGMLGGFPRRLSALDRERQRAHVVALDGGDLTGRDLQAHPRLLEAKTRAALELLSRARVAAVVVGEKDLRLGWEPLRRAALAAGVTLLGANLTAPDATVPFARAHRVEAGGQRTVVLAGVLDPELGDPTGQLTVGDPDAAARAAFADAPEGALRVLLFHGARERALETLGEDLPVDLIVCGHEREAVRPAERRGRAWLVETVRDARAIARVELADQGEPRHDQLPLDGQVPDDAWARGRVDRYYAEVAGLPEPPRRPTPEGGDFTGSQACMDCHMSAYEVFVETKHFRAYPRVLEADPTRGPLTECVGCHVTGHGFEGGFRPDVTETAHLAEVGCESCHGVGGNHVADEGGRGYGVKPGFPESWRATCVGCHDASNSPGFDFPRALERIKHWPD